MHRPLVIISRRLTSVIICGICVMHMYVAQRTADYRLGIISVLHSFLAIRPLWRCVIDEPYSLSSELYFLLLPYSILSLGQKKQSVCVYSTTRRVLAAATVCRWWQFLTEYDGSQSKYVVGFSGGVEKVGLRAKALHQTSNYPVLCDYFNASNSVSVQTS